MSIRSPLRYPGGKSRALKSIIPLIPKDFEDYREPFLGGGSVFVHITQLFPNRQYWINDLYEELAVFWQMAQADMPALLTQVWLWRKEYKDGKRLHTFLVKNIRTLPPIQKAAAFFVLNRITFSGTSESGGYSNAAFEKRFTESSIQRLEQLTNIMEGVKITNEDYQTIVNAPGEGVFIFLDPPYYSATKSALYGKNGKLHRMFDHEAFAVAMQQCEHKWLITYDDDPYIRELFAFAAIREWNLTYGMRNVGKKSQQKAKEIFISNY